MRGCKFVNLTYRWTLRRVSSSFDLSSRPTRFLPKSKRLSRVDKRHRLSFVLTLGLLAFRYVMKDDRHLLTPGAHVRYTQKRLDLVPV